MARDMDQYGMGVSDVAVTLAALEEKGMGAADARRALRSAMSSAKGDVTALYRELGITEGQLSRLNEEIKGGSDYIDAMGEAYNDAQTPLQWVQMEAGKIGHALGADLNPLLEVGSVAMTGVSSALLMGASAAYLYSVASTTSLLPSLAASTASAWAFTTALLANPITWIVLGIVGLGAALYLLASNWDDISGWFMDRWEQVGSVVTGAIDWIGNAWDSTVGAIVAGADWLGDKLQFFGLLFPFTAPIAGMNLLRDNWDTVVGAIGAGWDWLVGAAQDGAAWLGETIGAGLSGIIDLFWQYNPLGIVIRQWDEITGYLEGIDLVETGRDILLGLVGGILDIRQQAIDAVMGIGEDLVESVTGFFGISSPSKLMQEMGHHVGEGFALGVGESMPDSIPLPDAIEGSIRPEPARGGYATVWTEPAVGPLAGQITYAPAITEPAIGSLTGEVRYTSVVGEPSVKDLIGSVTYQASLEEPRIPTLTGGAQYTSTLTEPAITDLAGTATYRAYLDGIEPDALQGEVTYLAKVIEPVISTLTGDLIYETRVSEPTIVDRAGTVVYETEMSEPTIAALTGAITYVATVLEPAIPLLTGAVTYLSEVLRPEVPALTGELTYETASLAPGNPSLVGEIQYTAAIEEPAISNTLTGEVGYHSVFEPPTVEAIGQQVLYSTTFDEPAVGDLAGRAIYSSTLVEPAVEDLTGAITYLATVMEPMIPALSGIVEYRGVADVPVLEDVEPYSPPESGDLWSPYTPERDALMMAGSTATTYAPSTTINVTTGSGDAREIATVVDRRLRQTFDRHAETYFARQRRRAAL
jgi:hypothetical protein